MFDSTFNQGRFSSKTLDIEMLGGPFLENLESIMRMLDEFSAGLPSEEGEGLGENDEEEDDDAEYAEAYGASREELKEYVRKFRDYAKDVKKSASEIYGGMSEAVKKSENAEGEPRMKSPEERGHKMICSCAGCMAFKEFYGIKIEKAHPIGPQSYFPFAADASSKRRADRYEETAARPCGGKLYHHFHGERAELKNVLGRYTASFNFIHAGY